MKIILGLTMIGLILVLSSCAVVVAKPVRVVAPPTEIIYY